MHTFSRSAGGSAPAARQVPSNITFDMLDVQVAKALKPQMRSTHKNLILRLRASENATSLKLGGIHLSDEMRELLEKAIIESGNHNIMHTDFATGAAKAFCGENYSEALLLTKKIMNAEKLTQKERKYASGIIHAIVKMTEEMGLSPKDKMAVWNTVAITRVPGQ